MSKHKSPYTFPLRTRRAIEDYLSKHGAYWPASSWNGGFVLSWNVKVYTLDWSGKSGEEKVNPFYDKQWEAYCKENTDTLFVYACEDAASYLTEGDYCTYPGDDQGSYEFFLNGRSGGHLCLSKCAIVPQPYVWAGIPFSFHSREHWQEYLIGLDFSELRTLYKAVVCMDSDFTQKKAEAEVNHHLNRQRAEWEREAIAEALLQHDVRMGGR